jgi:peptidoglycan hydrolase CwlO-like protein
MSEESQKPSRKGLRIIFRLIMFLCLVGCGIMIFLQSQKIEELESDLYSTERTVRDLDRTLDEVVDYVNELNESVNDLNSDINSLKSRVWNVEWN